MSQKWRVKFGGFGGNGGSYTFQALKAIRGACDCDAVTAKLIWSDGGVLLPSESGARRLTAELKIAGHDAWCGPAMW